MERRCCRRIIVLLRAEIISSVESYPGFLETPSEFDGVNFYTFAGTIENISEEGMMMTVPEAAKLNFNTGSIVDVSFQIPSDERVNLQCEIMWLRVITSHDGKSQRMGMEIVSPSPLYHEFIKAGHDQNK